MPNKSKNSYVLMENKDYEKTITTDAYCGRFTANQY